MKFLSFHRRFCLLFTLLLSVVMLYAQAPAEKLRIEWAVLENFYNNKNQFRSAFTFTNKGAAPLSTASWSLYFNFARHIDPSSLSDGHRIEHLNGDLYRLTLAERTLKSKESLEVLFTAGDWVVNFTDAPSGLYLLMNDNPEKGVAITDYHVVPSTEPKQYLRFKGDQVGLITPEMIYRQNDSIAALDAARITKIFPTPKSYVETGKYFPLSPSTVIVSDSAFLEEAAMLSEELFQAIGRRLNIRLRGSEIPRNAIVLSAKSQGGAEAYSLMVDTDKVVIESATRAGTFYGIQSLLTLVDPQALSRNQGQLRIAGVTVTDAPRFAHRAVFLDVSRNFQTKEQILKLVDAMALYKLNVLHLHLNDDEGWRIEIPGLPELTSYGSKRAHTRDEEQFLQPSFGSGPSEAKNAGTGFYSRQDYIEILQHAKRRHIKVIPEMEMPGHARAAVKSMEARYRRLMKEGKPQEAAQYLLQHPEDSSVYRSVQGWNDNIMDPAMNSTYSFLGKVFDEIISMYKEAQAPLETIHCGGDEVPAGVWERSPAVRELMKEKPAIETTDDLWYYFYGKVNKMLAERNLFLYGWEEVAMRKTKLDGKPHYIPNPDFVKDNVQVDVWNNVLGWGAEDLAYRLANAGYKVILSCVSHLYFDMAYYKSFDEPGYYWGGFTDVDKPFSFIPYDYFRNSSEDKFGAPLDRSVFIGKERLTDFGKQNIVGIQGLLWAENMINPERMEYMMFPKMLALAERAWTEDPAWSTKKGEAYRDLFKADYSEFLNVLGKRELKRLDHFRGGYLYRIPRPGVLKEGDVVKANTQYPGMEIRYTTNGTEPTAKSPLYTKPLPAKGVIKFRTFDSRGRGSKSVEVGGSSTRGVE